MNIFDSLSVNEAFTAAAVVPPIHETASEDQPVSKFVEHTPIPSQGQVFGCFDCGSYDQAGGIHWCSWEPSRFRNISLMKRCGRDSRPLNQGPKCPKQGAENGKLRA